MQRNIRRSPTLRQTSDGDLFTCFPLKCPEWVSFERRRRSRAVFGSCGQPAHAPESDVVHQQLAVMTRDRWKMHEWNKRGRPQAVINDADFQTETFGRCVRT